MVTPVIKQSKREVEAQKLLDEIADVRGKLTAVIEWVKFLNEDIGNGRMQTMIGGYEIAHRFLTQLGCGLLCGLELQDASELSQKQLRQVATDLRIVKRMPTFSNWEFPEGSYEVQPVILPETVKRRYRAKATMQGIVPNRPLWEHLKTTKRNQQEIQLRIVDPWE